MGATIIVTKSGYVTATRHVAIIGDIRLDIRIERMVMHTLSGTVSVNGDTRLDIQLVRR